MSNKRFDQGSKAWSELLLSTGTGPGPVVTLRHGSQQPAAAAAAALVTAAVPMVVGHRWLGVRQQTRSGRFSCKSVVVGPILAVPIQWECGLGVFVFVTACVCMWAEHGSQHLRNHDLYAAVSQSR